MTRCPEYGERDVLKGAQRLDACRIQTGLLSGFAQGCRDETVIFGIDASAGERDLPGMRAECRCAREQQHVEIAGDRSVLSIVIARKRVEHAEQDQHGRRAGIRHGRQPGEHLVPLPRGHALCESGELGPSGLRKGIGGHPFRLRRSRGAPAGQLARP